MSKLDPMVDRGSLWYKFAGWLVRRVYLGCMGGVTILHEDRVPLTGPLLVTPNHLSHIDPPLMGSCLPRALHFFAKKELFFFPLGALIRSLGAYPVSRGESDSSAIRTTIELLKAGHAVIMFPEGSRGDGTTLGEIQAGVSMLAKRSEAVVLPVGLAGPHKMLAKGKVFPRRARITICYGRPFTYQDIVELAGSEREAKAAFMPELERRIVEACHEAGLPVRTASEASNHN